MPPRWPLASVVCAGSLLLVLGSACGGRAFTRDGESAGTGGSELGGSGGGAAAGTSPGGNAGYSGYGGEACTAPPVSGSCEAYIPAWYHDPFTGLCRPFVYGGCDGNDNRYRSLAECQANCTGGSPDLDRCQQASDCVFTGTGCCGACDSATFDHDIISLNSQYLDQLSCSFALELPPPGGNNGASAPVDCAPCPPLGDGTMKFFVPDCVKKQCSVLDVRESALTACTTDQDCRVRRGNHCCESCGTDDLLAVRSDGSFDQFVCEGTGPAACPHCVELPTSALAYCGNDGQCALLHPTTE